MRLRYHVDYRFRAIPRRPLDENSEKDIKLYKSVEMVRRTFIEHKGRDLSLPRSCVENGLKMKDEIHMELSEPNSYQKHPLGRSK